jgi:hypothetical protein
MTMETLPVEDDAAWTQVEVDLPVEALGRLLADPVLVLRLNPLVTYECLERRSDGSLRIRAHNESNGQSIDTAATVISNHSPPALCFAYADGIKREARLQAWPTPSGATLRITDVYVSPADGDNPLKTVDHSLLPWTAALRRHLERDARWGRVPGYRWLANGVWPSMSPSHRRIAWLLIWTTAIEFCIFLGVVFVLRYR